VRPVWKCELVSVFVSSRKAIVAYAAVDRVKLTCRARNLPSSVTLRGSNPSSLSSSACARATSGSVYLSIDHDKFLGSWRILRYDPLRIYSLYPSGQWGYKGNVNQLASVSVGSRLDPVHLSSGTLCNVHQENHLGRPHPSQGVA